MPDIIKEILKDLPADKISDAVFEGANIVLYTKNKEFLVDNKMLIKSIVDKIKKRIELRPDPEITIDQEKTKKIISEIIPSEAGISEILFDPQRSQVIIEAEKPGLAIGKQGSLLKEIRDKTFWVPVIRRTPALKAKMVDDIRSVLYKFSEYRRKFLDKTGHRIYDGWIREKKHEWVRVTYLGGAREVGRSCILLQTPESRILLDCGVNVASEDHAYPYLDSPEFNLKELDAVIIGHAHLDHCGFVPYLFKYGYRGPVYCTEPTRDIMALLLLDYVKIMMSGRKEPIYGVDDIREMIKHTISLNYDEVTDITPDVRITLYNAGHIIGSAMCHIHVGNGLHNLLYTGDMKFGKTDLLDPATITFPRLETLMIESTYGSKDAILPPKSESDQVLIDLISETINNKGKILIPVLGVGRSQEVMVIINRLIKEGKIPEIPVYIQGIVWDITAIHTAYPEYLNRSVRRLIFHKDENPFLSPIFKRVGSAKERKQIVEEKGPCVIMATSGMMVGGPSVEFFKELANNPKHRIIFVNYLGEGSLGRRLQRGEKEVTFMQGQRQEVISVKMDIQTVEGLSGHSGRKQLMNFIYKCNPKPKKVIINHGENSRCLDLASSIHKQNRVETTAPRNLEAVRIK